MPGPARATSDGPAATHLSYPPPVITCDQCGHEVPSLEFCVRCGHPLGVERERAATRAGALRAQYAAAPDEAAGGVRIVSTLFPQLPRADMDVFRWALSIGVAVVLVLAVLGLYPVALVAAAVLVPLLMVLYLYDVDVYEDEPIRVIALTMAWGAVTGALLGLLLSSLLQVGSSSIIGPNLESIAVRGVVVPLLGLGVMLGGPLLLLRYRKFNDVLDGATFGAASAVSFIGAQALTNGIGLLSAGIQPPGDPLPWVGRLLMLGLAQPLLAAGVVGAAAGTFWMRYRTGGTTRATLGPLGEPAVATLVAAAALVATALIQLLAGLAVALVVVAIAAAAALVWLRRLIHVGLLQEAAEIPIADPVACANCGRATPYHSFCGHCGVALRALPKARGVPPTTSRDGEPRDAE